MLINLVFGLTDVAAAGALRLPAASGCSRPCSTCRSRCRRWSSGWRWCWSTTVATAGSGPPWSASASRSIFATPGMVMATVFVALPLMIREVVPVLEEIGDDQEQAARSLGAGAVADPSADHPARPSGGPSCTASCSSLARSLGRVRRGQDRLRQHRRQSQTATLVRRGDLPELPAGHLLRRSPPCWPSSPCLPRRRGHLRPQGAKDQPTMSIGDPRQGRPPHQDLSGRLRRPRRRLRGPAHRSAHRAARPQRGRQVDAAADHRRARERRLGHRRRSRATRPPTCRRRSATSASSSSTTPPSST